VVHYQAVLLLQGSWRRWERRANCHAGLFADAHAQHWESGCQQKQHGLQQSESMKPQMVRHNSIFDHHTAGEQMHPCCSKGRHHIWPTDLVNKSWT
jgi:hypothetical protein